MPLGASLTKLLTGAHLTSPNKLLGPKMGKKGLKALESCLFAASFLNFETRIVFFANSISKPSAYSGETPARAYSRTDFNNRALRGPSWPQVCILFIKANNWGDIHCSIL